MTPQFKKGQLKIFIKEALESYPVLRADDFKLYAYVCESMIPEIQGYSFKQALINHSQLGLPTFETITRARRLIQEQHPELNPESMINRYRDDKRESIINAIVSELHDF